jgi:hypothetical protein
MARSGGYIKFLMSGLGGKRIKALLNDGQRWRWWRLYCLSDKTVFPGLLVNQALQPLTEMEILSQVYNSSEFSSVVEACKVWEKEKKKFIEVNLLQGIKVDGETYLWNVDYHAYQDKFSTKGRRLKDRFYEAFIELDSKDVYLYLALLEACRPERVEMEVFGFPFDEPLAHETEKSNLIQTLELSQVRHLVEKKHKDINMLKEEIKRWMNSKEEGKANPDVKKFIDWWYQAYREKFDEKYHLTSKDAGIVKRLLGSYGFVKLTSLGKIFLDCEDAFIVKAGYTLGVFSSQINNLLSGSKGGRGRSLSEKICSKCKEKRTSFVGNICRECHEEKVHGKAIA